MCVCVCVCVCVHCIYIYDKHYIFSDHYSYNNIYIILHYLFHWPVNLSKCNYNILRMIYCEMIYVKRIQKRSHSALVAVVGGTSSKLDYVSLSWRPVCNNQQTLLNNAYGKSHWHQIVPVECVSYRDCKTSRNKLINFDWRTNSLYVLY